jgi:hypothetical protein
MTDEERRRMRDTHTPVPIAGLSELSRGLSKLSTSVIRMEGKIDTVKDDLLPPVSRAAQEARDGVLKLNGRVTTLEKTEHECVDEERQRRQDNDIAETRVKAAGISKLVWWLMGIAIVVGGSVMGFAMATRSDTSEARTQLRDLDGIDDKVVENSVKIQSLEKAQAEDRATYLRTVKSIPNEVEQVARSREPTLEEIEDATDDLPMTGREREMLKRILTKARARAERQAGDDGG